MQDADIPDVPRHLESMGEKTFFHCNNLTDLYFGGEMPDISGDLLFGTTDVTVHVLDIHADSWGSFAGNLVVETTPDGQGGMHGYVLTVLLAAAIILMIVTCIIKMRG